MTSCHAYDDQPRRPPCRSSPAYHRCKRTDSTYPRRPSRTYRARKRPTACTSWGQPTENAVSAPTSVTSRVILIDTSVWIDHLRLGDQAVGAALERGDVLIHPFVLGEIACGNLTNKRGEVLRLLATLPMAPSATDDEALGFIEQHALMGRGIGYIDVHLLAAVALAGQARLWTRDKRLAAIATELKLVHPNAH